MANKTMPILTTEKYLKANQKRLDLNTLIESMGEKITEAEKLKAVAELNDALEDLNDEVEAAAYRALVEKENPVFEALKEGSFDLYGAKPDDKGMYEFSAKMRLIDLVKMEKQSEKPIFANGQWANWIEALNHSIYNLFIVRHGIDAAKVSKKLKKFKISQLAEKLEIASLETKGGNIKALQQVLDAVIFEGVKDKKDNVVNKYKALGHHVDALMDCYASFSNKSIGTIVFPSDETFRRELMHVMNRIVTGKAFEGDQK